MSEDLLNVVSPSSSSHAMETTKTYTAAAAATVTVATEAAIAIFDVQNQMVMDVNVDVSEEKEEGDVVPHSPSSSPSSGLKLKFKPGAFRSGGSGKLLLKFGPAGENGEKKKRKMEVAAAAVPLDDATGIENDGDEQPRVVKRIKIDKGKGREKAINKESSKAIAAVKNTLDADGTEQVVHQSSGTSVAITTPKTATATKKATAATTAASSIAASKKPALALPTSIFTKLAKKLNTQPLLLEHLKEYRTSIANEHREEIKTIATLRAELGAAEKEAAERGRRAAEELHASQDMVAFWTDACNRECEEKLTFQEKLREFVGNRLGDFAIGEVGVVLEQLGAELMGLVERKETKEGKVPEA